MSYGLGALAEMAGPMSIDQAMKALNKICDMAAKFPQGDIGLDVNYTTDDLDGGNVDGPQHKAVKAARDFVHNVIATAQTMKGVSLGGSTAAASGAGFDVNDLTQHFKDAYLRSTDSRNAGLAYKGAQEFAQWLLKLCDKIRAAIASVTIISSSDSKSLIDSIGTAVKKAGASVASLFHRPDPGSGNIPPGKKPKPVQKPHPVKPFGGRPKPSKYKQCDNGVTVFANQDCPTNVDAYGNVTDQRGATPGGVAIVPPGSYAPQGPPSGPVIINTYVPPAAPATPYVPPGMQLCNDGSVQSASFPCKYPAGDPSDPGVIFWENCGKGVVVQAGKPCPPPQTYPPSGEPYGSTPIQWIPSGGWIVPQGGLVLGGGYASGGQNAPEWVQNPGVHGLSGLNSDGALAMVMRPKPVQKPDTSDDATTKWIFVGAAALLWYALKPHGRKTGR